MSFGFLLIPDPAQNIFNSVIRYAIEPNPNQWGLKERRTKFQKTDLNVIRGNVEAFTINFYTGQNPLNISLYQVFFKSVDDPKDINYQLEFEILMSSSGNNFSIGQVALNFSSAQTLSFPVRLNYEIRAQSGSDIVSLISGEIRTHDSLFSISP
jgi:hypothetical protein